MPSTSPRRVTTADVARAAGVSRGTVSYALNGDPDSRLRSETKKRVADAAKALGYEPSAAARLLRGGKSKTVLFLSPGVDTLNGQMSILVEALARSLAAEGFSLLWQLGVSGAPRPVSEISPAAVITAPTADDPEFAKLASGFSVPVLEAFPGRDEFVGSAGAAQVEYLASLGYVKIVFAGPENPELFAMSRLRFQAVSETCERLGLAPPTQITWTMERSRSASLLEAVCTDHHEERFAICAYNDDVALMIMAGAADAGITVPADVAVIGVDNVPAAATAVPSLTSVDADLSPFIAQMTARILSTIRGSEDTVVRLPAEHLIVRRASTPATAMT